MMDTEKEITKRLSVLAGLEVSGVNWTADMLTLQFGPLVSWISPRGSIKSVGIWALHIQCPWRIESAGAFYAGKSDFYELASESNEFVTLLDEKISALFGRASGTTVEATLPSSNPIVVQEVRADEFGGVEITLSGEFRLVIFPDGALSEAWRFFSAASDVKHLVVQGGVIDG